MYLCSFSSWSRMSKGQSTSTCMYACMYVCVCIISILVCDRFILVYMCVFVCVYYISISVCDHISISVYQ
jgi:hypothetical protein